MKRFVEGEDRRQGVLLPEVLDDWVSEENPVRAIDVFVDALDLAGLGFDGVAPAATGRPGYHPGLLLKLYVYGYLNQVASSRRLEREAERNVELMWLTGRLAPDFKTIADFRKDNGPAIRATCRQFVELCRTFGLFTLQVAAIDGSKFKAVNATDKAFTPSSLARRLEQTEASIARYLDALETADRQEGELVPAKTERLSQKIAAMRDQLQALQRMAVAVEAAPDWQNALTDPDARAMGTSGKGTAVVGYNVQAAVEADHHLIVAHEVTNVGSDRGQLATMAGETKAAMGAEALEVLADRGYFSGEQGAGLRGPRRHPLCAQAADLRGQGARALGKQDFAYDPDSDIYRCPAGERLTWRFASIEDGLRIHKYWSSNCGGCPLKHRCADGPHRRVRRWEHEAVIDAMQERLNRRPGVMRVRRAAVEHAFGTPKAWMGATHFKTRTLENVKPR
jgi:transposase